MRKMTLLATAVLVLAGPVSGLASERPEHYKGEPAETLEQAVANFAEYNDKLAAILAQDKLTPEDLHQVHQLTYTLENALQRMDSELDGLAEALEEVHLASEKADRDRVKTRGGDYLETAGKLVD